jgi:hypothetical protein
MPPSPELFLIDSSSEHLTGVWRCRLHLNCFCLFQTTMLGAEHTPSSALQDKMVNMDASEKRPTASLHCLDHAAMTDMNSFLPKSTHRFDCSCRSVNYLLLQANISSSTTVYELSLSHDRPASEVAYNHTR